MKQSSSPVEILSEGERRIVSLAAFLANVTGRDRCVPFIFDDPISSLDQDFEEMVAIRLAELSKDRQVIVFTHRLSLLGLFSEQTHETDDITISSGAWGTGNPDKLLSIHKSPNKALNELLNDHIAKAKRFYTKQEMNEYSQEAQSICSTFRKLVEKSVESILLSDVVQRHRRAITTKGKIGSLAKIQNEDCKFLNDMMTKYSRYEHSQSSEAPVDFPPPDELEEDVKKLINWCKEFKERESI